MIRTVWTLVAVTASTIFYGSWVIGASLVGVRDPIFYYRRVQGWGRSIIRAAGTPVTVHGMEHLLPGQPQVIVSNHVSWFDIFALAAVLPVPFHFVAKKELEGVPLFGTAWKAAGHISIDRSNRQKAMESLRRAGEKIRAENSAVIIYAEGTRSRTGRLLPFKKGAFMLAIEAGVPIVPLVVVGSYDVMRPDSILIRPAPIRLHFEPSVPVEGYTPARVEELVERVRTVMVRALGEEEALPPLPGRGVE